MMFQTEDKPIIEKLCASSEVWLYQLHSIYMLSPGQLLEASDRLAAAGIAYRVRGRVFRAPTFFEALLRNRHSIYHRTNEWKDPARILQADYSLSDRSKTLDLR